MYPHPLGYLYKKLLIFFQIGEIWYFIYNFQEIRFDFVSEELPLYLVMPKMRSSGADYG